VLHVHTCGAHHREMARDETGPARALGRLGGVLMARLRCGYPSRYQTARRCLRSHSSSSSSHPCDLTRHVASPGGAPLPLRNAADARSGSHLVTTILPSLRKLPLVIAENPILQLRWSKNPAGRGMGLQERRSGSNETQPERPANLRPGELLLRLNRGECGAGSGGRLSPK
jgi:hypothetical protein